MAKKHYFNTLTDAEIDYINSLKKVSLGTRQKQRAKLQHDTEKFLAEGGQIQQIPKGKGTVGALSFSTADYYRNRKI